MTRGSHARALDPEDPDRPPRADPIETAATRSVARLIEGRAQATGASGPVEHAQLSPAMKQSLAEQRHRHQLKRDELFHLYDCEQVAQRTTSLKQRSEQRRRRARHATNIAILLMWFSLLTTVVSIASMVRLVMFADHSSHAWSLSGVGLVSGSLASFGWGIAAAGRKARK